MQRVGRVERLPAPIEKLRAMKLDEAGKVVEEGVEETLSYMGFPRGHWTRIRTNNMLERVMREIRRRTRVVGNFLDGRSALMLVTARLRKRLRRAWRGLALIAETERYARFIDERVLWVRSAGTISASDLPAALAGLRELLSVHNWLPAGRAVLEDAQRMRMRATTIMDWDRKELIVPNKEFATGRLLNWTLSNKTTRRLVRVCVDLDSDADQVRDVLLKVARENKRVLDTPTPKALLEEIGNNGLIFSLRVYHPKISDRLRGLHELNAAIQAEFKRAGIKLAYPQLVLHPAVAGGRSAIDALRGSGRASGAGHAADPVEAIDPADTGPTISACGVAAGVPCPTAISAADISSSESTTRTMHDGR